MRIKSKSVFFDIRNFWFGCCWASQNYLVIEPNNLHLKRDEMPVDPYFGCNVNAEGCLTPDPSVTEIARHFLAEDPKLVRVTRIMVCPFPSLVFQIELERELPQDTAGY